jgi:hypothetical protein
MAKDECEKMSGQIIKVFSNIVVPDFMMPAVATHTFLNAGPQVIGRIFAHAIAMEEQRKIFVKYQRSQSD